MTPYLFLCLTIALFRVIISLLNISLRSVAEVARAGRFLLFEMARKTYPKYSVLMTVYHKEKAEFLRKAIDSMLNQTVRPSEFVLVEDGPLTDELYEAIKKYKKNPIFKVITLKENQGSGPASNAGVLACSCEWIARLDSDDYSVPERIEKQFRLLGADSELNVIGANVIEIETENPNNQQKVILPAENDEIHKFTGRRCPFRTSAILFKKDIVIKAGNYRAFHRVEDYDMFARLVANDARCANVQEFLTYMRIDKDYYKRRGGMKLAKSILRLKKNLMKMKLSGVKDWIISVPIQITVCLMPNSLRDLFYRKVLRG